MEERYQKKIVKTVLFLFCGLPGLLLFFVGAFGLMFELDNFFRRGIELNRHNLAITAVCIPLGSLLLLTGIGKIKKWLYLIVFISFPLFVALSGYISMAIGYKGKGFEWIILSGFLTFIVFKLINNFYRE